MIENGKVTVFNVATGEALSRFTVDARELVASGEYAFALEYVAPAETPADVAPVEAPADVAPVEAPADDTPARKGKV